MREKWLHVINFLSQTQRMTLGVWTRDADKTQVETIVDAVLLSAILTRRPSLDLSEHELRN